MADPTLFDGALVPTHPVRKTFDHWSEFFNNHAPIKAVLDSETSVEAAIANMPNRSTQRDRVLAYLQEWGPSTDEAIQDALAMEGSTERPRRLELVEAGLVVKAGTATTKSGRRAALWKAS